MNLTESLPLLKMAAESLDSAGAIKSLLDLVSQGKPYDQMFFSNLRDERWIPLLKESGFFSNLPSPVSDGSGATRYPRSPALHGLAQIAAIAPKETIEILESLPNSENPEIGNQIMRCISQIQDVALIPRCLEILRLLIEKQVQHDWIWIEEILTNWTSMGEAAAAIKLIGLYLHSQILRRESRYGSGTGWQFGEIDRDFVEPLASSHPLPLAAVFFSALCDWKKRQKELVSTNPTALEQLFDPLEEVPENPSTYWLEDFRSRTSHVHELEELLATRLFAIGSGVFAAGSRDLIVEFDRLLRSDDWALFSRLRWQLYADHPEVSLDWARADVLPLIPTFGHYSGSHGFEMAQMLEAQSTTHANGFLSLVEVSQYFATVLEGPIDDAGLRVVDDPYIKVFQRKQLYPIRSLFVGKTLEVYRTLEQEGSELPLTSYKPFSSGGGGARVIEHVAPKEARDMGSMKDEELWHFLNTWQPKSNRFESDTWWIEENVSALGFKFSELLESEPNRFQASERWWRNLKRPAILYKPLERAIARLSPKAKENLAVEEEVTAPTENEWRNWFGLAGWISMWGGEAAERDLTFDDPVRPEDRDWNWPRIMTVKFLASAIAPRFPVPDTLKSQIGDLLKRFVEDADPRLASKEQVLQDWLTTAINSVRGTALESLLQLAFHQRQESPNSQPELWIWDVVRASLVDESQSPAVFAILGSGLHLALYLYGERFMQEPGLLLPVWSKACRNAFILALVRYGNALGGLLKILPDFPSEALSCLEDLNSKVLVDREQQIGDFGGRLGTHLAFYFWNDDFPESVDGSDILSRYFDIAEPSQRSRAIGDIGRIFDKASPKEEHRWLFQRVRELWDKRFAVIHARRENHAYTPDDVHEELSAFIGWLGCECHPFDWRHERVLSAIRQLDKAPQAAFTIRTLESLSRVPAQLGPCIEILESILSKRSEIVSWEYRDKELKPLLLRGIQSSDKTVVARAIRIQETLLRHGLFSYLALDASSS